MKSSKEPGLPVADRLLHDNGIRNFAVCSVLAASALVAACAGPQTGAGRLASTTPPALRCDDGIKTSFKPDALTNVIEVRQVRKGEEIAVPDWPTKVKIAADLCLVKLLVGPGVTAEKDKAARSYSEGIGIEIWLPEKSAWNERVRNYGGGGWVGGDHRYAGKVGSKFPAPVIAGMGYASGTHDAGQPWYQDGSFAFLSNGGVNRESFRDMSYRGSYEQAVKTRALVKAYYGRDAKYAYYDGQSQGGRQGLKVMQEYPDLYDGYLIAQPAVSLFRLGVSNMYTQMVLKADLGFTAATPAAAPGGKTPAELFAAKWSAVNARAVASCDKAGLGYILDPFACSYDPAKDSAALCSGIAGQGVTGANANPATCVNLAEAQAINKMWYGLTVDGSYSSGQTTAARSGVALDPKQLWWSYTRGSNMAGLITKANTDMTALALGDVSYAAAAPFASGIPITNASTPVRNRWQELTYAGLTDAFVRGITQQPLFGHMMTDNPDLSRVRALGRKVIVHNGLAEDAIPPAGMVHYYHTVAGAIGGISATQGFMRMYMVPGMAHSSQGRAYTIDAAKTNTVPLPKLPGAINQTPTRETDQLFTALVDWVEKGSAPDDITITSRDGTVSYPICVYPKMTTWDGIGSPKIATSYACK